MLTALATKPKLQRNFAMIKHVLHKKKVNFSLKITSCDRGKGKSAPNGIMFYSGSVLQVGKAQAR